MTHQYQNVTFSRNVSQFVDVSNPNENTTTFRSALINVPVKGGEVKVVKGSVLSQVTKDVTVCGDVCPASITEQVRVEFNVQQGAENFEALRLEVNRLLDVAVEQHNMLKGIVPPVYATFEAP